MRVMRVGTRGSELALRQSHKIAEQLQAAVPDLRVEPVVIRTSGDRIQDRSLAEAGGKGLFIRELEEAMLRGDIDFAVHSAKDLPSVTPDPFEIPAVSEREDAADMLLSLPEKEISVVGTASPRRELFIRQLLPGAEVRLLRGNVPTRVRKLRDGQYDAIILASAGVNRLGLNLSGLTVRKFTASEMVPASGQGILACEAVKGSEAAELLSLIDHPKEHTLFDVERRIMQLLGADCHDAAGVYSEWDHNTIRVCAFYQTPVIRETTLHAEQFAEEIDRLVKELRP